MSSESEDASRGPSRFRKNIKNIQNLSIEELPNSVKVAVFGILFIAAILTGLWYLNRLGGDVQGAKTTAPIESPKRVTPSDAQTRYDSLAPWQLSIISEDGDEAPPPNAKTAWLESDGSIKWTKKSIDGIKWRELQPLKIQSFKFDTEDTVVFKTDSSMVYHVFTDQVLIFSDQPNSAVQFKAGGKVLSATLGQ